jgi:hypothetical protein
VETVRCWWGTHMRYAPGCLSERPRLATSTALGSGFEQVRAGVSAHVRQPHGWMLMMRGRTPVRSSYEEQASNACVGGSHPIEHVNTVSHRLRPEPLGARLCSSIVCAPPRTSKV